MSQLAGYHDSPSLRWAIAVPLLGVFMAVVVLVSQLSIEAAGILYSVGFLGIMFRRPELGLMMIFMFAPFSDNVAPLGPVNFTVADYSLILATLVLLFRVVIGQRRFRYGPLMVPIALYLLVCFVSVLAHWRGGIAVSSFVQMQIYFFCAIVVFASTVDRKDRLLPALYGLLGAALVLAVVLTLSGGSYVLGLHKNSSGATLSIAMIVAVELWFGATDRSRRKLLMVVTVVIGMGLFFTLSRGSWMTAVVGCGVIVGLRRRYDLLLKLIGVAVPVLILCFLFLPEQKQDVAFDFDPETNSIQSRIKVIEYTWDLFKANPVIGVGLGFRKQVDATNIVMVTLAETGLLGLAFFGLIHVVFLWMVWWAQKRLRRDDPLFSLLAIGAGALFGQLAHGLVDHYWSRGILTVVWASVGMATLAYLTVRQRAKLGMNR